MAKATPTRKVGSGAVGGAIATVIIWVITATTGVEIPAEVAAAVTVIVTAGLAYLVPDATAPGQVEKAPGRQE